MTACAMIAGIVPMALALEHGSEMEAPLGRAVIGGLLLSTFVTLFIVPSVFALLMGRSKPRSPPPPARPPAGIAPRLISAPRSLNMPPIFTNATVMR